VKTGASVDDVAREVGANLVVLGTVQGQGDHVSVTANVQDVATHRWLWSKTVSGDQNDLLDLEDQLSTDLIRALNVSGTPEAQGTSKQPTQNIEAYDMYLKGRDLLKGRPDSKTVNSALQLFQNACEKDPSFALAWAGVADASLALYRLDHTSFWQEKALLAARKAVSENASVPETHLSLGTVYSQSGKNAEAISEIQRAVQLEPNSDDAYVRLGRAYLAAGQSDQAITALKKAVELNPYYWYNHDQLGKAYFRMGRNDNALEEFRRVADLDPSNAAVHNSIGIIYFRESLWDKSAVEFQKAIALQPTADAYTDLGTAYFFMDRYKESIASFEKAVSLDPKKVLFLGNLADAYRADRQLVKAKATYDKAIAVGYEQLEVNPRDSGTLGNLALYYAKEGDAAKASELIMQARKLDPSDNQLMYNEATVEALNGRAQDALKALTLAIHNGYSVQEANRDPDLRSVRSLPEFQQILAGGRR
jgi:tetratricopeptide (TPR) repeat protein